MNHPPYHLRINKAVDRLLLVKVLRAILTATKQCTYYSLAGPFLEDLRVIDYAFPWMRLESIESSEETFRRQEFHKFRRDIVLNYLADNRFIRDYDPDERNDEVAVFWLDYTGLKLSHLTNFGEILKKVPLGSVVRVTLRAEPDKSLNGLKEHLTEEQVEAIRELKNQKFKDTYSAYLDAEHEDICVGDEEFAITVQLMVRNVASKSLDISGSQRDFLHLHSVRYNDNTQMLSVTGLLYDRNKTGVPANTELTKESFIERLQNVPMVDFNWNRPDNINIPALTLKERLKLEEHLPISDSDAVGEILHQHLGYKIDSSGKNSEQLLQYAKYHREYPHFIRMLD